MAFKTNESSVTVLPPEQSGGKTTKTTVETGLEETNPEVYLKRAKFFESEYLPVQAGREYDAALRHSRGMVKYRYQKARFCLNSGRTREGILLYLRGVWRATAFLWMLLAACLCGSSHPYWASGLGALGVLSFLCCGFVNWKNWEKVDLDLLGVQFRGWLGDMLNPKKLFAWIFKVIFLVAAMVFGMGVCLFFFLGLCFTTPVGPIFLIGVGIWILIYLVSLIRFFFTGECSATAAYAEAVKKVELDAKALLEEAYLAPEPEKAERRAMAPADVVLALCLVVLVGRIALSAVESAAAPRPPRSSLDLEPAAIDEPADGEFYEEADEPADWELYEETDELAEAAPVCFSDKAYPDGDESLTPVIYTPGLDLTKEEYNDLAAKQRAGLIAYFNCGEENLWPMEILCSQGGEPKISFRYIDDYQTICGDVSPILLEDGRAAWCDNSMVEIQFETDRFYYSGEFYIETLDQDFFGPPTVLEKTIDARSLSLDQQRARIAEYMGLEEEQLVYDGLNLAGRAQFTVQDGGPYGKWILLDDGTVAGGVAGGVPHRIVGKENAFSGYTLAEQRTLLERYFGCPESGPDRHIFYSNEISAADGDWRPFFCHLDRNGNLDRFYLADGIAVCRLIDLLTDEYEQMERTSYHDDIPQEWLFPPGGLSVPDAVPATETSANWN